MALSNWDCIAFTDKGEPSNGVFQSPIGIKVEIYKNWIFVTDDVAWQEGGFAFTKPIVMKIYGGVVHYKDVDIVSRWIDGTIYLIVWSGYSEEDTFSGMVGIGTNGFGRNGQYYGIRKSQIRRLSKIICDEDIPEIIPIEFRKIDLSKGRRFNQGDMFFSNVTGIPKNDTNVGNAEEPLLTKIFKSNSF